MQVDIADVAVDGRQFSETVGLVYDSAMDAALWPKALQNLAGYFDGHVGSVIVANPEEKSLQLATFWGKRPDTEESFNVFAREDHPFVHLLPRLEDGQPHNSQILIDMMEPSRRVLTKSYLNEYGEKYGFRDVAASVIWKERNRFGLLSISTPLTRDVVSAEELELLSLFLPHVKRAVMIGDLLNLKVPGSTTFDRVLDSVGHAAIVVGRDGKVLFCNSKGKALLDGKQIIRMAAGKLHAMDGLAEASLTRALHLAAQDESTIGRSGIGIPLAREPVPALAYVLPLERRSVFQGWSNEATAVVLVKTTDAGPLTSQEALAALFALTPAEARTAIAMSRHSSREEAAAELGVGVETIKIHLSRVFEKTGCGNQRELAHLVERLGPPG